MTIKEKLEASRERERALTARLLEIPGADTIDPTNGQDVLALIRQQQMITQTLDDLETGMT